MKYEVKQMVTILMASYNGIKYIEEQIKSIINQSYKDWQLIICDDCSTDGTFELISEYAKRHENIIAVKNEINSGSAKNNFMQMIVKYKADYIMLCDQDDIWLKDKIKITYEKIVELEGKYSRETPVLVHTDLTIADESLKILCESYDYYSKANSKDSKMTHLILENVATGCTIMYNKALAELITDMPEFFVMHDWWLVLTAQLFGKVEYVDKPTMLYRQHGKNNTGAKNFTNPLSVLKLAMNKNFLKQNLYNTYLQAESLLNYYEDKLSQTDRKLLMLYKEIPKKNKILRCTSIVSLKTYKHSFLRKIGQFIYI